MEDLKWTGERLVTSVDAIHGVVEHLHRYALAMQISKDRVVLDIASGEGYGSYLISKNARKVYGVDIDNISVLHAQAKYAFRDNLEYLCGSTSNIPLPDNSIDMVISFETLEHHDEHDKMMVEILRVLKNDGCLLLSSPEKSIYKQRDPNNPYHIKELSFEELDKILNKYFKYKHHFTQRFVIGSLIHSCDSVLKSDFKMFDGNYQDIYEDIGNDEFYNKPFFNLAICSNKEIATCLVPTFSLFNGVKVIKKEMEVLKNINAQTFRTTSFRVGSWIVRNLSFLKKFKRN